MDDEKLVFFPWLELGSAGSCQPRNKHVVAPHMHSMRYGDMSVICRKCAKICECCDELLEEGLYHTPASIHIPHDELCEWCAKKTTCDHSDESDAWPEECLSCGKGCRNIETLTIGGIEKDVCERCPEST
jgi:hypothetical protein